MGTMSLGVLPTTSDGARFTKSALRVRGRSFSPLKHRDHSKNVASRGFVLFVVMICAFVLSWSSIGLPAVPLVRHHVQLVNGADSSNSVASAPTSAVDLANKPVTLAFFLQISGSTMGHLPRLLAKIWEPCNVYAIHIDAKIPAQEVKTLHESLLKENSKYADNVYIMDPELITYRGVSMLLNTINGMQLLLEKGADWDFFINLSGSDYPLISPAQQRAFLGSASRALNYMTLAPPSKWPSNNEYRYSHFYVDTALSFTTGKTKVEAVYHKNPAALKSEFTFTSSEAWMISSRQFCEYVTKSAVARKLLVTFAFSVESSEHYFSTLLYNSRFNGTMVHSSLRSVLWSHEGVLAGQHPYFVDERAEDGSFKFYKRVITAPQFYIRKFKKANSPLMDVIDKRMNNIEHLKNVQHHFKWLVMTAKDRALHQPSKMPFD